MKNISELSTKDLTNNKVVSSIRKNPIVTTYALANGIGYGIAVKASGYSTAVAVSYGICVAASAAVVGYCVKEAWNSMK